MQIVVVAVISHEVLVVCEQGMTEGVTGLGILRADPEVTGTGDDIVPKDEGPR